MLTVVQWQQMGQAFHAVRQYCNDSNARLHSSLLDVILGMLSALSTATQTMGGSDDGVRARVEAFASVWWLFRDSLCDADMTDGFPSFRR